MNGVKWRSSIFGLVLRVEGNNNMHMFCSSTLIVELMLKSAFFSLKIRLNVIFILNTPVHFNVVEINI